MQGVPKKKTRFLSLITASDFKIQTTSNLSKKEVLNFVFDVLFMQFVKHIISKVAIKMLAYF